MADVFAGALARKQVDERLQTSFWRFDARKKFGLLPDRLTSAPSAAEFPIQRTPRNWLNFVVRNIPSKAGRS